jgi:O-antigen ligase
MMKSKFSYLIFVESMAALLLVFYPGLMFAVKGGMNGAFLFLLLLSIAVLIVQPREIPGVVWNSELKVYLLATAALPVAIFLSQTFHHHYGGHPYDAASRFLLAVPIFMLLQRLRFSIVAMVQYAFPIAAIVGCLMLKPIADGRIGIATLDLIHFGDFELVLGVMSLLCLNWTGRDAPLLKVLKVIGFLAGVYASVVSGSRGGWIALPVFLTIYIYYKLGKISLKSLIITPLILIIAGLIAFTFSQKIHHRVDEVTGDLYAFQHGNPDTPTGVRLQLFQSAAVIFVHNPIFGVGAEGFSLEMEPLLKAGKITAMAAELGKGEVHNEILSRAAGLGLFGLMAILSIYLVPVRIFYRSMKSTSIQLRKSGLLGLVFVSGFMVFGLTVEVLNLTMATAFYSLTVAVLLAACLNIHHGEQVSPNTL